MFFRRNLEEGDEEKRKLGRLSEDLLIRIVKKSVPNFFTHDVTTIEGMATNPCVAHGPGKERYLSDTPSALTVFAFR
uniref:Uncharacterized protein n=1 Tax=Candidatus Kentrum sp. TC TaxID=2126339 RepID=A0A450ZNM6_9GAMM|nr:MAG: hypothetical protein BECKTC1821D_GA0114238_101913 [Candidatus Kentron sp. TC]VFK55367.1 MAG: hypothetical protein BECKTC1821F_GA0114240_100684 [Candidatus Kentron sp. TC]